MNSKQNVSMIFGDRRIGFKSPPSHYGSSVLQEGRELPVQGTMKLSTEAYKRLAHRAIDAEIRPSELLDAIILYADWEKDLPALVSRIEAARTTPESSPERKPEKTPESADHLREPEKSLRAT
ncbi:MAG: hypothetical protein NT137_00100 [Methanomassiliicoccales archaeon]|nr:hypothetical protein [Methanomassiliicoccales archaeon]